MKYMRLLVITLAFLTAALRPTAAHSAKSKMINPANTVQTVVSGNVEPTSHAVESTTVRLSTEQVIQFSQKVTHLANMMSPSMVQMIKLLVVPTRIF